MCLLSFFLSFSRNVNFIAVSKEPSLLIDFLHLHACHQLNLFFIISFPSDYFDLFSFFFSWFVCYDYWFENFIFCNICIQCCKFPCNLCPTNLICCVFIFIYLFLNIPQISFFWPMWITSVLFSFQVLQLFLLFFYCLFSWLL